MDPAVLVEWVNHAATWVEALVGALTLLMYKVILPLLGVAYAFTKLTPSDSDDLWVKRWFNRFKKSKNALANPDEE